LRHADPRALDVRFTIGQVLALTWRAWLACRWPIILIGVPTAIVAAVARWLMSAHIDNMSGGWQDMLLAWQDLLVQCVAYVGITFAAVSYMQGRSTAARDVLRIPWRRLPVAVAAGFIMQCAAYWPLALLDWDLDSWYGILVDYVVTAINVLTFEVLAFVWLPVVVLEHRTLAEALRRGIRLATRHPWRILAIDIGLWGIYFAFSEGVTQVYYLIDPRWGNPAWYAMITVWIILNLSISCCLAAAAYHMICA
jgi:hypothetical protein